MKYVVMSGNIFSGVVLHGPFEDANAATMWAEQADIGDEWRVVPVHQPE